MAEFFSFEAVLYRSRELAAHGSRLLSLIGTALEWCDFFIYGTASALASRAWPSHAVLIS